MDSPRAGRARLCACCLKAWPNVVKCHYSNRMENPAQLLFNRVARTWIRPALLSLAEKKLEGNPFILLHALIVWDSRKTPSVYLNEEIQGKIITARYIATGPIEKGQAITVGDIKGVTDAVLAKSLRNKPYIYIVQGRDGQYFLTSKRMEGIFETNEFEILREPLSKMGLALGSRDKKLSVFLDLQRNRYDLGDVKIKRRLFNELKQELVQSVQEDAGSRVKRYLRLPTLIVHQDNEYLPMLREARQSYIDGNYFSCIATSVTTTDRICNRWMEVFQSKPNYKKKLHRMTFGGKATFLFEQGYFDKSQKIILDRLNLIRRRHLHPKKPLSQLTLRRDAFRAVKLMHDFVETTFSVFRDYEIEEGKFVPKPLINDK